MNQNKEISSKKNQIVHALYYNYAKELLGFIKNKVQDKDESYDILHDVFLSVLQKDNTEFIVKEQFKRYLFKCASNKITDHYRRVGKAKLETMQPEDISETTFVYDLEKIVINGEIIDTVHNAMRTLTEEESEIMYRKYYINQKKSKICGEIHLSRYKLDKMLSNIILKVKENLPSYFST